MSPCVSEPVVWCELPMYPCHTYFLPPSRLIKTMGHYKGKANTFVFLLGTVHPLLAYPFQRLLSQPDTGLAVCTWKDGNLGGKNAAIFPRYRPTIFGEIHHSFFHKIH